MLLMVGIDVDDRGDVDVPWSDMVGRLFPGLLGEESKLGYFCVPSACGGAITWVTGWDWLRHSR